MNRVVLPYINAARNDLVTAGEAELSLWRRSDTDVLGALFDLREAVEALTRATASLATGLEQLSHVVAVTYDESDDQEPAEEPDVDDEPPPDYGPPGCGAVVTEWP
jgi:hypothetical protein